VTEKSDFLDPKLTLAELGVQLMLPELSQHGPQVLFLLFCGLGVDQYIVDEDYDTLVHLIHEDLVRHVHEVRRAISPAKRHDCVLVLPRPGYKRRLVDVLRANLHLVITRQEINLAKVFGLP
jgi:hypothetical protein